MEEWEKEEERKELRKGAWKIVAGIAITQIAILIDYFILTIPIINIWLVETMNSSDTDETILLLWLILNITVLAIMLVIRVILKIATFGMELIIKQRNI